jgi:hypothetical protein
VPGGARARTRGRRRGRRRRIPLPAPAGRGDHRGFRLEATTDWLAPLEEGLGTLGRSELATVVLAVIRGLIMDLEATADTPRVNQAFSDFISALRTALAIPATA